ncbi:MAG: SpoIID/LytB domain-containing protein, partial [Elusimicrobia bacterium]|nr:SpoIID/LytB domain-containing protein [Elusimicrobiota bacterium]
MKKTLLIFWAFLIACLFSACAPRAIRPAVPEQIVATRDVPKYMRIGILLNADSFTVSSNSVFFVQDGSQRIRLSRGNARFRLENGQLRHGRQSFSLPVTITPTDGIIFVGDNAYRGVLVIQEGRNGRLDIINKLWMEYYVKGILPREMPAAWGKEALKAQAVISRSYALRGIGKHVTFDLC